MEADSLEQARRRFRARVAAAKRAAGKARGQPSPLVKPGKPLRVISAERVAEMLREAGAPEVAAENIHWLARRLSAIANTTEAIRAAQEHAAEIARRGRSGSFRKALNRFHAALSELERFIPKQPPSRTKTNVTRGEFELIRELLSLRAAASDLPPRPRVQTWHLIAEQIACLYARATGQNRFSRVAPLPHFVRLALQECEGYVRTVDAVDQALRRERESLERPRLHSLEELLTRR